MENRITTPFTWIHIQVPLSGIQSKSVGMNEPLNVAHLVLMSFP
jgi:hypothetical protein